MVLTTPIAMTMTILRMVRMDLTTPIATVMRSMVIHTNI
jgi:hypothetical protein